MKPKARRRENRAGTLTAIIQLPTLVLKQSGSRTTGNLIHPAVSGERGDRDREMGRSGGFEGTFGGSAHGGVSGAGEGDGGGGCVANFAECVRPEGGQEGVSEWSEGAGEGLRVGFVGGPARFQQVARGSERWFCRREGG